MTVLLEQDYFDRARHGDSDISLYQACQAHHPAIRPYQVLCQLGRVCLSLVMLSQHMLQWQSKQRRRAWFTIGGAEALRGSAF